MQKIILLIANIIQNHVVFFASLRLCVKTKAASAARMTNQQKEKSEQN